MLSRDSRQKLHMGSPLAEELSGAPLKVFRDILLCGFHQHWALFRTFSGSDKVPEFSPNREFIHISWVLHYYSSLRCIESDTFRFIEAFVL